MDYTYDQTGGLSSISYPDGTDVEITPDSMGRIATLEIDSTETATYQYIGPRVAERKYPAPATEVVYRPTYDNLGRLKTAHTYQGAIDILKFAYSYEPNTFNISRIKFDHRTTPLDPCDDFAYDNLDRLTMARYGVDDVNEIFTVDDLGNRLNVNLHNGTDVNYIVDNLTNRYEKVGDANLYYDEAGNLIADKDGYEYEYDYENRITEIKKNGSTTVAEFAYDALGRRIKKYDNIAMETTLYYYGSGWQVLAEYDTSDNLQRRFVYGNYIDEALVMNDGANDYYYAQDHLYSTAALLDNTGAVVERYEYDAYGQPYIMDSSYGARGTSLYDNPYLFTGRRVDFLDDGGLTLQYSRNRYFDYYTGRWLSHDPIGYSAGINLYEYVSSNPEIYVDPTGLTKIPTIPEGGIVYDFTDWPSNFVHTSLYSFYNLRPVYYEWPDGTPADYVKLGGDFLLDVRGGSQLVKFQNDIANILELKAKTEYEKLDCDLTTTFGGSGKKSIHVGIMTPKDMLFTPNVMFSLQNFTVYYKADCEIGPKECDVTIPDCPKDCGRKALWKCNISWTLYDLYDFRKINILGWGGHPFHIFGSWKSFEGGVITSCKGK
jgi:RHS repeat-associated protein